VSNYDLIIQNGTVATAADVFQADIGIKDGKIVQIGQSLSGAARTIDASGKYVLPGGIDSHVERTTVMRNCMMAQTIRPTRGSRSPAGR
jgi:dihydroorotase-like cyclic amidohydrolase